MFEKIKEILSKPKVKKLTEGDLYGPRFPYERLSSYRYAGSQTPFGRDIYPWKSTTIRNLLDLDRSRFIGRELFDTNPQAKSVIDSLRNAVIGKGFTVKCVDEEAEEKPEDAVNEEGQEQDEIGQDKPEAGQNEGAIEQAQEIINDFNKANKITFKQRESYVRYHVDGESFIRLYPQQDEPTQMRFIEPDIVRPPLSSVDTEREWAWGCYHKMQDWDRITKYNLIYFDGNEEIVQADEIFHLKNNVRSNVLRGVSSFWACWEELYSAQRLRKAAAEGEKIRQAITYVRQHETADQQYIQQLQDAEQTGEWQRYDMDGNQREVIAARDEIGTVVDIPKGLEMINGPEGFAENFAIVEKQLLLSVAARFNVASFVLTGDGDSASYASAVVSYAPMQQRVIGDQEILCQYWLDIYMRVLDIAAEKGEIGTNWRDQFEIHVTAPCSSRQQKESVETQKILVDGGIMSDQTWAAQNDLDLDEEVSKGAKKAQILNDGPSEPDTMSGKMQKETK